MNSQRSQEGRSYLRLKQVAEKIDSALDERMSDLVSQKCKTRFPLEILSCAFRNIHRIETVINPLRKDGQLSEDYDFVKRAIIETSPQAMLDVADELGLRVYTGYLDSPLKFMLTDGRLGYRFVRGDGSVYMFKEKSSVGVKTPKRVEKLAFCFS